MLVFVQRVANDSIGQTEFAEVVASECFSSDSRLSAFLVAILILRALYGIKCVGNAFLKFSESQSGSERRTELREMRLEDNPGL